MIHGMVFIIYLFIYYFINCLAGTTTLVGGVLYELDTNTDSKYAFLFINVGDCKVFHYDNKNDSVEDLTEVNRVTDATDPGGRLGPYLDNNDPGI